MDRVLQRQVLLLGVRKYFLYCTCHPGIEGRVCGAHMGSGSRTHFGQFKNDVEALSLNQ